MRKLNMRTLVLGFTAFLLCLAVAFGQNPEVAKLIKANDDLNDQNDYVTAFKKIMEADKLEPDNPQIMWRVARAYFNIADQSPDDEAVQKANMYPGFEYAKRCVEKAPEIAGGHQYYAILIGRIGEIEGTKQKIENSYAVREHTLIAIDLDPENDSNYHVMGRWNYALADLSWVERKIASIIYATPPDATFEEAVEFFTKANEIAGGDDIRHLLWMGKSYIKLEKKDLAKKILQASLKIKAATDGERSMQKEAQELLKKL